jgi:hypothetical protein
MRSHLILTIRFLVLAAALFACQVIAGMISGFIPQPALATASGPSPITVGQALLLVIAGWTLLVGLLARHVQGTYWERAGFLFVVLFLVNCALSAVEAAFFLAVIHMQVLNIVAMVVNGLAFAALVALCAAWLVPRLDPLRSVSLRRSSRPAWAVVGFYLLAYSLAGYFIAWQSADVRNFYQLGSQIPLGWMPFLQIARATVWLWVVLLCVRQLRGRRFPLAMLVGLSFAGLMALGLLFPGPFPWPVRAIHLIEIGSSNTVFGVVAFLWLTAPEEPEALRRGVIGEDK